MTTQEATVEVLTAEVRTLMVGSRQVTMSVARQLDRVGPEEITPFGRIRTGLPNRFAAIDQIEVVGSAKGVLVRATEFVARHYCGGRFPDQTEGFERGEEVIYLQCPDHREAGAGWHYWQCRPDSPRCQPDFWAVWSALPLIVLAGLR